MNSLIDIDETETREKIIKTLHYFLDNNDYIKARLELSMKHSISKFIHIYSNIKIDKDKFKEYIYKYIEKYYIETLKNKYDITKTDFKNDISRCNFELKRRYIDILYDINKYPNNDDNKDYNYISQILNRINFENFIIDTNGQQVYDYILFNEINSNYEILNDNYKSLNDSINKNKNKINDNYKTLNDSINNTNNKLNDNYKSLNDSINKLNDKINDNYEILNNKINDKIKNNYEFLNNKYNIIFEINVILFITVMYNLLFK